MSRWLSWSDFFSRQIQQLQFAAHHAGADCDAVGLLHPLAQLVQGDIRLPGDFGAQPSRIRGQGAAAATGVGPRGTTAGVSHARTQAFYKTPAHPQSLGDGPLGELAGRQRVGDPFT